MASHRSDGGRRRLIPELTAVGPLRWSQLTALATLAVDLAAAAGQVHRRGLEGPFRVEIKSSPTDLVSEVDREAERVIVERLKSVRPDDSIQSEEGTLIDGTSGVRWVIDPLDGTTNALYGYPVFAASVGVEIDGRLQIGAVYDSSTGHCYKAVSGFGAFCDDRPIRVRRQSDIAQSLVATGFSYEAAQREHQGAVMALVLGRVQRHPSRRSGGP